MHTIGTTRKLIVQFKKSSHLPRNELFEIEYHIQRSAVAKYPHFFILLGGAMEFKFTVQYETTSESLMTYQMQEAANFIMSEGARYGLQPL